MLSRHRKTIRSAAAVTCHVIIHHLQECNDELQSPARRLIAQSKVTRLLYKTSMRVR